MGCRGLSTITTKKTRHLSQPPSQHTRQPSMRSPTAAGRHNHRNLVSICMRIEDSTGAGRCACDAGHHIVSPQAVHQLRGGLHRILDLLALRAGWCCGQLVGQLFQAAHFSGAILAQQRLAAVIGPDLFDLPASGAAVVASQNRSGV
jgi:hypothetical protein